MLEAPPAPHHLRRPAYEFCVNKIQFMNWTMQLMDFFALFSFAIISIVIPTNVPLVGLFRPD